MTIQLEAADTKIAALMKKIKDYPHRAAALAALLLLFSTVPLSAFVVYNLKDNKVSAAPATIDISAEAIQKVHISQVPHTDINGNFKTVRDQNSFFPIGIYNPTLCQVTKQLSWQAGPPNTAGWNGEYRIKINYGNSRAIGTYLISDINVGNVLTGSVGNLPPSSVLYYSVWQNRTNVVVAEGVFTSDTCTNTAEESNFQSIKNAGYNLAILEKNVYPDQNVLSRAQESSLKLLLDMRDRPSSTFANLNGNPNIFGFYVGDDDLARAKFANTDPQQNDVDVAAIYSDLNNFADGLDSQTNKVVLAAEPDIDSSNGAYWLDWYNQFDSVGNVSFHYNYPKAPIFGFNTIKGIADTVLHQVQINGSGRPSWFISQAINLKWVIPFEFPTPEEARAMKFAAFIHGATGIFDFSYDGWFRRQPKGTPAASNIDRIEWYDRHAGIKANTPTSYPGGDKWSYATSDLEKQQSIDLWNGLDASQNGVNKQIIDLKDVILSPTVSNEYKVFVDQTPISTAPVRTIFKKHNGDYYLMAVNIDDAPINTRFDFQSMSFSSGQVLFENRSVTFVDNNKIEELFAPYAVHVYKLQQDDDGDGVSNEVDNCVGVANSDQANFNSEPFLLPDDKFNYDDATNPNEDNLGDACDDDIDHDGLTNNEEQSLGTMTVNRDTDGDTYLDGNENRCGSDPKSSSSTPIKPDGVNNALDIDRDQLPDNCEQYYGGNVNAADTDSDGLNDGLEARWGTKIDMADTDGDNCSDKMEIASVNGDRAVTSIDLSQVAQRFGPGTSNLYHFDIDVNADGRINSIDLSQVAQAFGPCS